MSFLSSLFGGSGNSVVTMLLALGIVLVLIVLGMWLLKVIFNASGSVVRGRNRRLAVVDTLALDQKRQLVIVRRDDVEHLILTGGPQDVVVETGIAVEDAPANQAGRRSAVAAITARKPTAKAPPVAAPIPAVSAEPPMAPVEPEPTPLRAPRSLKDTGLLRSVGPSEPVPGHNPDNSALAPADSAKEDGSEPGRQGAAVDTHAQDGHRG